ncbi:RipA family octameric membrane protein [Gimibacter soli]|uniref:TIR domain-containing protein n=1 Tax=Gimibacter soli TaxID=3024400 RepID=A0AAE9XRL5_9PROT|nr:hypothetical protein [Gimibacter soli]WCL53635.1 hypothetical protein PH603_13935 [Gimibacter soli]
MRGEASKFFASIRQSHGIHVQPCFLKRSYGKKWKAQAESLIDSAEVVIIYDAEACAESENTRWELEKALELGKPVVELSRDDIGSRKLGALKSAYDFQSEFDQCFVVDNENKQQLMELYRIMVESSETLIGRRQITNGFFITVIGALISGSGFVIKEGILNEGSTIFLIFPFFIGILMCKSWRSLIENYGKLNAGKFKVIHKIERQFDAQIYAAEWISLGKGFRKEKYQSFTNTEENVPNYFLYLLYLMLIFVAFSADWLLMVKTLLGLFF